MRSECYVWQSHNVVYLFKICRRLKVLYNCYRKKRVFVKNFLKVCTSYAFPEDFGTRFYKVAVTNYSTALNSRYIVAKIRPTVISVLKFRRLCCYAEPPASEFRPKGTGHRAKHESGINGWTGPVLVRSRRFKQIFRALASTAENATKLLKITVVILAPPLKHRSEATRYQTVNLTSGTKTLGWSCVLRFKNIKIFFIVIFCFNRLFDMLK